MLFYNIIHQFLRILPFITFILQSQHFGCSSSNNEPTPNISDVSAKNPLEILVPLPLNDTDRKANPFGITQMKVIPVIDAALEDIYGMHILPYNSLSITLADTKSSDAIGPNAVIAALENKLVCIIGFAYDYALRPVAKITPGMHDSNSVGGIPVITTVGWSRLFENRSDFPLLTRISAKEWTTTPLAPFTAAEELPAAYKKFEEALHLRAEHKFKYLQIVGQKYEINRFVEAFYDALMLYAYAVNESLARNQNPRDGVHLTQKMRSRCFRRTGISVCIDANGDRTNDGNVGNFSFFGTGELWSIQSISGNTSYPKCKSTLVILGTINMNCTTQIILVLCALAVFLASVSLSAIRIFYYHFVRSNKKWNSMKGKGRAAVNEYDAIIADLPAH